MTAYRDPAPNSTTHYKGRFAPSPTGPLHLGSLVAACGSYLEARSRGGNWHLRIDDLDSLREVPGAAEEILRTLDAFGFEWDGPVVYQSRRTSQYREALQSLEANGHIYPCGCSRKAIAATARPGAIGPVYPGTCRSAPAAPRGRRAWRVNSEGAQIRFEDRLHGRLTCDLANEVGDYVVRRADGPYAYHLAAAVDDAAEGYTDIVRGYDLLWCTVPQIHLQRLLNLPTPRYAHLPIVANPSGEKLSKQTGAPTLARDAARHALFRALDLLQQQPPGDLVESSLEDIWAWAVRNWHTQPLIGLCEVHIQEH